MAEGGLNTWGMTEGLLWLLCYSRRAPLSCPPVVSGNPVFFLFLYLCGPAWEKDGFPITNVGNDRGGITNVGYGRGMIEHVGHDGRHGLGPLSCPLVLLCHSRRLLAGIQCFAFCSFICVGRHGKTMDSRLIMSGMTEGGLNTSGMTEGRLTMSGMTEGRLPTSGMTEGGLPMSGMTAGDYQRRVWERGRSGRTGGRRREEFNQGGLPRILFLRDISAL